MFSKFVLQIFLTIACFHSTLGATFGPEIHASAKAKCDELKKGKIPLGHQINPEKNCNITCNFLVPGSHEGGMFVVDIKNVSAQLDDGAPCKSNHECYKGDCIRVNGNLTLQIQNFTSPNDNVDMDRATMTVKVDGLTLGMLKENNPVYEVTVEAKRESIIAFVLKERNVTVEEISISVIDAHLKHHLGNCMSGVNFDCCFSADWS